MSESQLPPRQQQYDLSLDDVRDYLLHSGAIKEAESFLHVVETEERRQENHENQIAKEISHFKPKQIKERIESDREAKRDAILHRLLTEKRSGAAGMLQEEEEMRRLQAMEARLREENAETELMHQRLAIEIQDAKRLQLDDLTAQTRREMLALEAKRRDMEKEMANQQMEVEKVQNELREAEKQLLAADENKKIEVNRQVVTIDSRRKEMQALAEEHAQKLSVSNAYRLSAQNDKFQLENGGFFDSKLYNMKYSGDDSINKNSRNTDNQGSNIANTNPNASEFVDSLATELGIQRQEKRIQELNSESPAWKKETLADLPVPHFEKTRNETTNPSHLHYKGVKNVTPNDFLDNWLASDEKLVEVLGKTTATSSAPSLLPKQKQASSRDRLGDEGNSVSPSAAITNMHPLDTKQKNIGTAGISARRRGEDGDGGEEESMPVMRSQSADKQMQRRNLPQRDINNRTQDHQNNKATRSRRDRSREQAESEQGRSEYVYQQRFDPSRARPQRGAVEDQHNYDHQQHQQQQQHAMAYGRDGEGMGAGARPLNNHAQNNHAQHNPYQQQEHYGYQQQPTHGPFVPLNPYHQQPLHQHQPPMHNPYNPYHPPYTQYNPYQQPPIAYPNPFSPYQQQGSHYPSQHPNQNPFQQFQQPPPYPNLQHPPPYSLQEHQQQQQQFSANPPPSMYQDPFLGEMKKLEKMIESENEKLFSNPALLDVNKSLLPATNQSNGEGLQNNSIAVTQSPPRRRNRAELKHHYEMEAIKHDMEKMRQVSALEALKVQLETDKVAKQSEVAHEMWLNDQKRLMQSLKIKQAVLTEEDNFQRTENLVHPKSSAAPTSVPAPPVKKNTPREDSTSSENDKKSPSLSKSSLHRGETIEPLKYLDKLFVAVDGVTIAAEAMFGDQYRVMVSLFESKSKKIVGRAYQSEWEEWTKPAGEGSQTMKTMFLKNAITKTPPSKMYSRHRNAVKCDNLSEADLSNDPGNFLKVLVEVQARVLNQPHQSVGWVVFDLPLVSSLRGLPTPLTPIPPKPVKVSIGAWRMRGRTGIKDAFGAQMSSKTDSLEMWLLFRINAPQEAQIDSLKGEYLTSEEVLLRHEPLDGDFGIHPTESKNNRFRKFKRVGDVMKAVKSFKSLSTDKSVSSELPPLDKTPSLPASKRPSVASSHRSSHLSSRHSSRRSSRLSIKSSASKKSFQTDATKAKNVVSALEALKSGDSDDESDSKGSSRSKSRSKSRSRSNSRSRNGRRRSRSGSRSVRSWSSRSRSSRSRSSSSRSSRSRSRSRSISRSRSRSRSDESDRDDSVGEKSHVDRDDPMSKFWTLGTPVRPCDCKYQKGDGVDIYIDKAMFLPDNCTVSRVVVKLMTSEYEVIGEVYESVSLATEGSNISPVYNFKIECRKDVYNVTLTALIRIDTMDSVTLDTVGVGYAAIKVFSTLNREQPTLSKQPDTFINTGLFQLPLHAGRLKKGSSMTEKSLQEQKCLPLLPCASLLVRIYAAPKAPDGLLVLSRSDFPQADWVRKKVDIPAPSTYLGGDYDGCQCESTFPLEITAFEAKAALPVKTVEHACSEAVAAKPKSSLPSRVHAPPDNARPTEMQEWLESLLLPVSATRGILDYTLAVPYSFMGGMSLTVERLYKMPSFGMFSSNDVLYKVIYSTSPPGLLYKDPPLAEGVHFTANTKHTSELYAPEFEDGPVIFNPTNIEQSLCVIFDVRLLHMEFDKLSSSYKLKIDPNKDKNKNKDKKYWTIFPVGAETVLKGGYTHVQSGVFQLPLFEGEVPTDITASLNPLRQVLDTLAEKKSSISLCDTGASVLFKFLNPTLGVVLADEQTNWTDHISTKYLDMILQAARTGNSHIKSENFTYVHNEYVGSVKTIQKQFTKGGTDVKKLLKDVNKEFAAAYNLHYDD